MAARSKAPGSIDILIAEDDAITRMTLLRLLEDEGYRCAEAEEGGETLEIARQCQPRLLLLDVMMPVLDGFQVAKELRSDPRTQGAHILFLTGRNDAAARAAARQLGGEMLMSKP